MNELYAEYRRGTRWPPVDDFCAITEITPQILNYAMRLSNFTGYTGEINFRSSSRARLSKNFKQRVSFLVFVFSQKLLCLQHFLIAR